MISGLGIVLLVSEPQHAALDLFVSPECRQTHTSQFFGKKGADLTQHMESQWGLYEADRWHCPLYLQKTINPQASPPRWLLFGPAEQADEESGRKSEKIQLESALAISTFPSLVTQQKPYKHVSRSPTILPILLK